MRLLLSLEKSIADKSSKSDLGNSKEELDSTFSLFVFIESVTQAKQALKPLASVFSNFKTLSDS